jgi:hypothetical protein
VELSKQQKQIVDCKDRNIIVDAGSGSGKTRTLTEKVRQVLISGVDPKSVVVITFTNLAADELKKRLKDVPKSNKCFIGTIHSYANKLLKKTGFEYEIFSELHQNEFMKSLIPNYARYCTMDDYVIFLRLRKLVNRGLLSESEMPYKFTDPKVYKEIRYLLGEESNYNYTETVKTLCEMNHIISFDELLKLSTKYFEESGVILEYLFVDELQDIGWLEYKFLKKLGARHNFWIGDDYQCQPAGTIVDTDSGEKKIEDIVIGDYVKSYDPRTQELSFNMVSSTQTSVTDSIVRAVTEVGMPEYTPNHRCFARLNCVSDESTISVLFLCRTTTGEYFIGSAYFRIKLNEYLFTCGHGEITDIWILAKYNHNSDCVDSAQLCAYSYGIPLAVPGVYTEELRHTDIRARVETLLSAYGKDINFPLLSKHTPMFSDNVIEVRACNLIPEIMSLIYVVPTYNNEYKGIVYHEITDVCLERKTQEVYCIEVQNTGTYVSDGFATHNSIYAFKGGDVGIFLSLMKDPEWKEFYLTENYRTAQQIMNYANMIIAQADDIIKKDCVCKNETVGEVKFNSKTQLESFVNSLDKNESWMFLTRTNKELYELGARLKKLGVKFYSVMNAPESEAQKNKIMAENKIKIMTVHKSKGLEDDNIALYGKFPIKPTKDKDEYKVFYVGITRAKNKCVIFL